MSRSTADWRLRLEANAWVLRTPAGLRREAVEGDPQGALERFQPEALGRGAGLRVVFGDVWLRYLVVHWPRGVRRASERQVFLAHRFQQVHGVAAPDWTIVADADASGFPALACAAPTALIDAVQAFARRCRLPLRGVGGDFVDCFNRLQAGFAEPAGSLAALALARGQRVTVGMWRDGAWLGVRSQHLPAEGEGGALGVRRMIELMHGPAGEEGAPGVLYACRLAAAVPEGWRLQPLEEGACD